MGAGKGRVRPREAEAVAGRLGKGGLPFSVPNGVEFLGRIMRHQPHELSAVPVAALAEK